MACTVPDELDEAVGVVGDCSVVLVVLRVPAELVVLVEFVESGLVVLAVAVDVRVEPEVPAVFEPPDETADFVAAVVPRCGKAASVAKAPTPAMEPAATTPVTERERRSQRSRRVGVTMPSFTQPRQRVS